MPLARKPILCYVTDRRALDPAGGIDRLLAAIRNAVAAGVGWIQIREKDLNASQLAVFVRLSIDSTQGTDTKILVNDRLDVALATGAGGVHLGEMSLPVDAVVGWKRSAGRSEFQVGVSCHSMESALAAERAGANYILFGPVFSTPSKASFGPPQGIESLRKVCASVQIPVLAIGGINLENAIWCIEAGATGVAAIRLFQESTDAAARLHKM